MPRQFGSTMGSRRRGLIGALLGAALVLAPGAVSSAQTPPPTSTANPTWAVTLSTTTPYAGLEDDAPALPALPALTLLEVVRYVGDWAEVTNPRTREAMYVESAVLGPS